MKVPSRQEWPSRQVGKEEVKWKQVLFLGMGER
ncbi:hypothetical protein C5S31_09360 [ANME-1 cluster archaeon GoMg2]|nr:hypothetical protein [ANME-1 cluster archaeon GoMg2]